MKFLAGINLLLLAALLTVILAREGTGLYDAAVWYRDAHATRAEWQACQGKHEALKRTIRKEGLWRRLGLDGQPWLR